MTTVHSRESFKAHGVCVCVCVWCLYVPPTTNHFEEAKYYKAQMYYHPSSSLTERVDTSSTGQHHPRMAGFKFKCVCVCACVSACTHVYICVCMYGVCVRACVRAYVNVCVLRVCVVWYVCVCMCMCACVCVV